MNALKELQISLVVNFIWINISEVFRYFVFVMPMMRESLPSIPNVAPMNLPVFLVWGVWDTILIVIATFIPWLLYQQFGKTIQTVFFAGTTVWLAVFGLLWLGLFNMNLATPNILFVALPLAWFEMMVAAYIVYRFAK